VRKLFFLFFLFGLGPESLQAQNLYEGDSTILSIRSIEFVGNKVTKEFVFLREMNLKEGDTVSAYRLEEVLEFNQIRILNSKLFSEVTYLVLNRAADKIDVQFKVRELFYWAVHPYLELADRNFNVWWEQMGRDLNRINIGLDFDRKNFRGRGEEIGGEVQIGFNKHIYLYYDNPYVSKNLKHGIRAIASYNTGKETQTQTDSNKQVFHRIESENPFRWYRAQLSWLFRPAYYGVHELGLGLHHWTITDSLINEQPAFLGMGKNEMSYLEFFYKFKYNNTDDRNYPEQGLEFEFMASQKGLGVFNDVSQLQFYNHIGIYKKLSDRVSLAFHERARLSFGPDQPFLLNRAMGFKNDFIRGYEYYLMDGTHYALARADVRYKFLDFSLRQEYLPIFQHIPIKVYGKTYYDAGYAYNKYQGNNFLNNRFLNSYGAGIDLVVSYYVLLRIEYSFNHLGENGLFLHSRKE